VKVSAAREISIPFDGMTANALVQVISWCFLMIRFDELRIPCDELKIRSHVHVTSARFTEIASRFRIRRFDNLTLTTEVLEMKLDVLRVRCKDFSIESGSSL
jgi:hypothetical protein